MAEVQLCIRCKKVILKDQDYVVVRQAHQAMPAKVAHVECEQKAG
jgi:hypothetical protein